MIYVDIIRNDKELRHIMFSKYCKINNRVVSVWDYLNMNTDNDGATNIDNALKEDHVYFEVVYHNDEWTYEIEANITRNFFRVIKMTKPRDYAGYIGYDDPNTKIARISINDLNNYVSGNTKINWILDINEREELKKQLELPYYDNYNMTVMDYLKYCKELKTF